MVNGIVHREEIDMETDKEGCWVTYEYYEKLKEQLKKEALLKASVTEREVDGE